MVAAGCSRSASPYSCRARDAGPVVWSPAGVLLAWSPTRAIAHAETQPNDAGVDLRLFLSDGGSWATVWVPEMVSWLVTRRFGTRG